MHLTRAEKRDKGLSNNQTARGTQCADKQKNIFFLQTRLVYNLRQKQFIIKLTE